MATESAHSLEGEISPAAVQIVPAVKLPSSDFASESSEPSHGHIRGSSQNTVRLDPGVLPPSSENEGPRAAGVAEYAAHKLRSALQDCRRLRRELIAFSRPSQSDAPTLSIDLSCPICSNPFDCALSLPLCLPCGHTMCSSCVMKLTRRSSLLCPFDRQQFDTEKTQMPVNLAVTQVAVVELASALCQRHGGQVIAYCVATGELLCGFCNHEVEHKHVLLDSPEAFVLAQEQQIALSQRLTEAWLLSKQLSSLSLEVESLLLRLTVKFNGFSLMHKATKRERRLSRRFSDVLLRIRAELEESQKAVQSYLRTQSCVYWNADSVERWQWLVWRLLPMPKVAMVGKAMEALQKWLKEDQ